MALLRDYHAAIGEIVIKYGGTLERFAGDGVMVIFNDPVPLENPALQAVLMALDMRAAIGGMIEKWRDLGHDLGFGIGIAHGFATLGTIGFEGRFDYAAIGTVSIRSARLWPAGACTASAPRRFRHHASDRTDCRSGRIRAT
jgi:adenylate cyclase